MVDIDKMVFNPPGPDCVLYLPGLGGGDSQIYDRSACGNHGAITGALWRSLPYGLWYLDCDGSDDFVNCGNNASLNAAGTLTIKMWLKIEGGAGTHRFLVHKAETPADDYKAYSLSVADNNKLRPHLYISGALKTFDSVLTPAADKWYSVVFTFDGSVIKLYINGAYDSELVAPGTIGTTAAPLYLGRRAASFPFNGGIAFPEIHKVPWTALEVQNCYQREKRLFGVW